MSKVTTAKQKKTPKTSQYVVLHDGSEHQITMRDGRYIYCADGLKIRHFSRQLKEIVEKCE